MDARTGKSILIVEDEPLIALDHDETVRRAGFTQVTIVSSCAAAREWLESHTPSVALLDVQLRDGPCVDVATYLRKNGVPFAVCSASIKEDANPVFQESIWLSKPCMPENLITALTQAKVKVAGQ
jgi:DNA-binding response OmpR family regulator